MAYERSWNNLMRKVGTGVMSACTVLCIARYFEIFFFFWSFYLSAVLTTPELCSLFDFPWISICKTEQKTSGEYYLTQIFPILYAFSQRQKGGIKSGYLLALVHLIHQKPESS